MLAKKHCFKDFKPVFSRDWWRVSLTADPAVSLPSLHVMSYMERRRGEVGNVTLWEKLGPVLGQSLPTPVLMTVRLVLLNLFTGTGLIGNWRGFEWHRTGQCHHLLI